MKKEYYSSGAEWEEKFGYTRAVKIGSTIEVAGTTAVKDGKVVGQNDMAKQTETIILIIEKALENFGGSLENVVRTRMYVTDISLWEEAGKMHGKYFGKIKPASTLVEVSNLVDPDMLIEIEATAIFDA